MTDLTATLRAPLAQSTDLEQATKKIRRRSGMGRELHIDFHEPLKDGDKPEQTIGCRHTNPDICGFNSLENVCAFARADGLCEHPPRSWKRQYKALQMTKLEEPTR